MVDQPDEPDGPFEEQDVLLELMAKVDQLTYLVNVLASDMGALLQALPAPARGAIEQRRVLFHGHVITLQDGQYHLDGFACSAADLHALLTHFEAPDTVFEQMYQLGTISLVK